MFRSDKQRKAMFANMFSNRFAKRQYNMSYDQGEESDDYDEKGFSDDIFIQSTLPIVSDLKIDKDIDKINTKLDIVRRSDMVDKYFNGESDYLEKPDPNRIFKSWNEDYTVNKMMPLKQLYHMRAMDNIYYGGPHNNFDNYWNNDFTKFRNEKRESYGDELFHQIEDRELFDAYINKKKKEIEDKGYIVLQPKIRSYKGDYFQAKIPYRHTANKLKERKEETMQPFNISGALFGSKDNEYYIEPNEVGGYKEAAKVYKDNLAKEMYKGKNNIPIIGISRSDAAKGRIGEGRHRILAAMDVGLNEIPVAVEVRDGKPVMSNKPIEAN